MSVANYLRMVIDTLSTRVGGSYENEKTNFDYIV
jgi:hypothetical protein